MCPSPESRSPKKPRLYRDKQKHVGTNLGSILVKYFHHLVRVCRPLNVINGEVLGFGTLAGSAVRIQCKKGYQLRSTDALFRTCQRNGQWTGGSQTIQCQSKNICHFFLCFEVMFCYRLSNILVAITEEIRQDSYILISIEKIQIVHV